MKHLVLLPLLLLSFGLKAFDALPSSLPVDSCYGDVTFNVQESNNAFHLGYNGDESYHLTIYNRWGCFVVRNKDKMQTWDGKQKQNAKKTLI